jgi:hypothetical protein
MCQQNKSNPQNPQEAKSFIEIKHILTASKPTKPSRSKKFY